MDIDDWFTAIWDEALKDAPARLTGKWVMEAIKDISIAFYVSFQRYTTRQERLLCLYRLVDKRPDAANVLALSPSYHRNQALN